MREGYRAAWKGASGGLWRQDFPDEVLPIYASCTKPSEVHMAHKFWRGAYSGGSADARYENGKVWRGAYSGGSADARYENGKIWSGAYTGGSADARYEDGKIWLGAYTGGSADARYDDGKIWIGAYTGGSADGRYEGPDAGAAAAAWLLLIG